MSNRVVQRAALLVLCVGVAMGSAAEGKRGRGRVEPKRPSQNSTCNDVPAHPLDLVLGRPTRDSVTLSVLVYQDTQGSVAYGTHPDQLSRQTPTRRFSKGEPVEVVIDSLQADARYFYQFRVAGVPNAQGTFQRA